MADTEQHLLRYKSHLEKNPNEDRLMQILNKLDRLPVTVDLLQSTGIGKTVNGFRKHEGNIGITAKTLVRKWKSLVADQANLEKAYEQSSPDQNNHRQGNNHGEAHANKSHHRSQNGRGRDSQSASSSHHKYTHESSKERRGTRDAGNLCESSERRVEKLRHGDRKVKYRNLEGHGTQKPERSESPEHLSSPPVEDSSSGEEDITDLPSGHWANDSDADSRDNEESPHDTRFDDVKDSKKRSGAKDTHRSHNDHSTRKNSSKDSHRSHKDGEDRKSSSKDHHRSSHGDGSRKSSSGSKLNSEKAHNVHHKSSTNSLKDKSSSSKSPGKSGSKRSAKDETYASLFSPDEVLKPSAEKTSKSSGTKDIKNNSSYNDMDFEGFSEEPECDISETRKAVKRPAESGQVENSRKIAKKDSNSVKVESDAEDTGMSFEDLLSYDQALVKKVMKKKKERESSEKGTGASHKPTGASSMMHSDKNASDSSNKHTRHSTSEKSHSHSSRLHSSKDKSHLHSSSGKSKTHSSSGKSKSHSSSTSGKNDSKSSSSKHSSKDKHASKHSTDSGTRHSSSVKGHGNADKHNSSVREDNSNSSPASLGIPAPPKQEIRLTDADILGYLPETQAYYKPLRFHDMDEQRSKASKSRYVPHIMGKFLGSLLQGIDHLQLKYAPCERPPYVDCTCRSLDEVGAVDPMVIGSKSYSRTQVYSGRKNTGLTDMVSLYELCMRVLMDNIDGLDYVGGVPYYILKPVLEKCSAEQLYRLEDYNPQFLGETDELWMILCNRDFRGAKPDEMESWRELYLRLYDEREVKLQKLKANIAASEEARKAPVRHTKLAYVDTVAKPPRDVRRKQMKYGTATVDMNPSGSKPNPAGYQRSSLKSRLAMDTAPVAPRRVMKAPAPMMQKTMKMIKKLQRR